MPPAQFSDPKAHALWQSSQRQHWAELSTARGGRWRLRTGKLCHCGNTRFQGSKSSSQCLTRQQDLTGAWGHLAVHGIVLQSHQISISILNFQFDKSTNLANPPSYKTAIVFQFKQVIGTKTIYHQIWHRQEIKCIQPCAIKSNQLVTNYIKNKKMSFVPPTQMNCNVPWKKSLFKLYK